MTLFGYNNKKHLLEWVENRAKEIGISDDLAYQISVNTMNYFEQFIESLFINQP
jgi:hypothetical protein